MALFAHLEIEDKLQIKDKSRFNGSKSFVSVGSDSITDVTVKPGADGSAITVFNSSQDLWYLDWQFNTWNGDFDVTNNKLDFNEGGSELTATVSAGTYTLATLAAEIKTQMDSAGANTYTVSVDKDDKITISADGQFSLLPNTGSNSETSILPIIGFSSKPGFDDHLYENETSITGERVRSLPKAVTLEVDDGTLTDSQTKYVNLYSVAGDALFSNDNDLRSKKSDILRWVERGRNSFLNYHRAAQDEILNWCREEGYIDINGDPLEIKNFTNPTDLNLWSTYLTMRLIFDDLSNANDDIFYKEARGFESKEMKHRKMAFLRLDVDNDGKSDVGEGVKSRSVRLIRQ